MYKVDRRGQTKTLIQTKTNIIETVVLLVGILYHGLFEEWVCGACGIVLMVLLLARIRETNSLQLPKEPLLVMLSILPIAALVTIPYAIDGGMAALGFIKFFPVAVWTLLVKEEEKEGLLRLIPFAGALTALIGLIAWVTPLRDSFYLNNNRLSGTFQYANSFALFLLIGIIIVLWKKYAIWQKIIIFTISTAGVMATGSRTVFCLLVLVVIVWLICCIVDRKPANLAIFAGIFFAMMLTMPKVVERFTSLNIESSSFSARILYNIDGIKMVLEHPFGLGYKGFLFYQGAVQSGNYSATFAHNELLQTALDFGIIIAIAMAVAWIIAVFRKEIKLENRIILIVAVLHSLFDWSLQFGVILLIVVLATENEQVKEVKFAGKARAAACGIAALACAVSLWLSIAAFMEYTGNFGIAVNVYPYLTSSQMRVINEAESDKERYEAAESICRRNDYCTIALQAMAEKSAREGNFEKMAEYGERAMKTARYNTTGYELYLYLLSYAVETCGQQGKQNEALGYLQKVTEVTEQIENVNKSTNALAYNLYNKPDIQLSPEYLDYIEKAESIMEGRI